MADAHLERYGQFPEGIHAIEVGDVAYRRVRRFNVVVPYEPDSEYLGRYADAAAVIEENKAELIDDMYDYATSEYPELEWDEDLSQRDGENLLGSLRRSMENGRSAECRHFVLGLFVYYPGEATEERRLQRVVPDEFLDPFISVWRYMRDRLETKFSEADIDDRLAATEMLDALLETTIIDTLTDPRTVPMIEAEIVPNAKPERSTQAISTSWQPLIETPFYYVPGSGFAMGYELQHGAAELSSPVLVTNKTSGEAVFDLRFVELDGTEHIVTHETPVQPDDTTLVPLNGQFILSGERLEIRSNVDEGLIANVSYTVGEIEMEQTDDNVGEA